MHVWGGCGPSNPLKRPRLVRTQTSRHWTKPQEVEYVKQEAKLPYLLECLQKTAPPVLIFAENKVRGAVLGSSRRQPPQALSLR